MSDIFGGAPSSVPGSTGDMTASAPPMPGQQNAILPPMNRAPSGSEMLHTRAGLIDLYWADISRLESAAHEYANWLNNVRNLLVDKLAVQMEDYAKANAPWQDRTGQARAQLNAKAYHGAEQSWVDLSQGVDYGVWLETMQGGRLAIIMPTIMAFASRVGEIERETASNVRVSGVY